MKLLLRLPTAKGLVGIPVLVWHPGITMLVWVADSYTCCDVGDTMLLAAATVSPPCKDVGERS